MTAFERPAPDIGKIVAAWRAWRDQDPATKDTDDGVLPGRTMADLKIGGLDAVLATLSEDNVDLADISAAWHLWERGKVGPDETLAALDSAGLGDLVAALAEAE